MLIQAQNAGLLIVDVQARLLPSIDGAAEVLQHNIWLAQLAEVLQLPTVISEHCRDKIGATDAALSAAAPSAQYIAKTRFSAAHNLHGTALAACRQVIITGIEAHVCVLQTAIELQQNGQQVFLVAEAVGSRRAHDKTLALNRMQQLGVQMVSREMVAFECLAQADHPQFKAVLQQFIR